MLDSANSIKRTSLPMPPTALYTFFF